MTTLFRKTAIASAVTTALLGTGLPSAAQAAPEKFTLDPAHTYPFFEINHLGWSNTRGLFHKTTGSVVLDFAAKSGAVEVEIDANSLDTFDAKRDDHLRGEQFFDVAKYPVLRFTSQKLVFNGEKLAKAEGYLTLHGIAKPVALQFNLFKCGEHPVYKKHYCGGDASATIKRSDFGISAYPGAVGDEVKLMIQVEAARN